MNGQFEISEGVLSLLHLKRSRRHYVVDSCAIEISSKEETFGKSFLTKFVTKVAPIVIMASDDSDDGAADSF
jgi:hypothetical protein